MWGGFLELMQRQASEMACLGDGSPADAFKTECVPVSEPKDWEMEGKRKRRREDAVLASATLAKYSKLDILYITGVSFAHGSGNQEVHYLWNFSGTCLNHSKKSALPSHLLILPSPFSAPSTLTGVVMYRFRDQADLTHPCLSFKCRGAVHTVFVLFKCLLPRLE